MYSDDDFSPSERQDVPSFNSSMEGDEISLSDVQGDYEKHLETLQTFTNSLPYECETPEQMQEALEGIIEKLYIAVNAKHWNMLSTWTGMLKGCVRLKIYLSPFV